MAFSTKLLVSLFPNFVGVRVVSFAPHEGRALSSWTIRIVVGNAALDRWIYLAGITTQRWAEVTSVFELPLSRPNVGNNNLVSP